jgi:hypothetical protein
MRLLKFLGITLYLVLWIVALFNNNPRVIYSLPEIFYNTDLRPGLLQSNNQSFVGAGVQALHFAAHLTAGSNVAIIGHGGNKSTAGDLYNSGVRVHRLSVIAADGVGSGDQQTDYCRLHWASLKFQQVDIHENVDILQLEKDNSHVRKLSLIFCNVARGNYIHPKAWGNYIHCSYFLY